MDVGTLEGNTSGNELGRVVDDVGNKMGREVKGQ